MAVELCPPRVLCFLALSLESHHQGDLSPVFATNPGNGIQKSKIGHRPVWILIVCAVQSQAVP